MSLSAISILIGLLAVIGSGLALFNTNEVKKGIKRFPRSKIPAWILTALCCWMGAHEAFYMNMGFLDAYKKLIYFIAPSVFVASVVYMEELLAARALGGFLCLIAVPIVHIARWHESSWRLLIISIVYLWVIFGIILLMSPWYYRKVASLLLQNEKVLKAASVLTLLLGFLLIALGIFEF